MCISDVLYAVLFCLIVEVRVSLLKALEISKEAVFLVKQTDFFCLLHIREQHNSHLQLQTLAFNLSVQLWILYLTAHKLFIGLSKSLMFTCTKITLNFISRTPQRNRSPTLLFEYLECIYKPYFYCYTHVCHPHVLKWDHFLCLIFQCFILG